MFLIAPFATDAFAWSLIAFWLFVCVFVCTKTSQYRSTEVMCSFPFRLAVRSAHVADIRATTFGGPRHRAIATGIRCALTVFVQPQRPGLPPQGDPRPVFPPHPRPDGKTDDHYRGPHGPDLQSQHQTAGPCNTHPFFVSHAVSYVSPTLTA